MNLSRRALPGILAFAAPAFARAEAFPVRPLRLVTPIPAGVGAEATLRLFAENLSRRWGQPVTIENHPGGDGVIAAMAFLSHRDDHKLFVSFAGPFTVNPSTIPNLPYRVAQFASVTTIAIDHIAVVASPSLPVANLTDAVRLARAGGRNVAWASSPGGIAIAFAAFAAEQRLELTHVQYRAVPDMLNDLSEGRIQLAAMPLATALPQARGGRLKLLAVTNATRSPAAPDLATAGEQGFATYVFEGFVGVFADARQPVPVRMALEEATRAVVAEDGFASRVRAAGQTPFAGGPADLDGRITAQQVLVQAGLRHMPPGG